MTLLLIFCWGWRKAVGSERKLVLDGWMVYYDCQRNVSDLNMMPMSKTNLSLTFLYPFYTKNMLCVFNLLSLFLYSSMAVVCFVDFRCFSREVFSFQVFHRVQVKYFLISSSFENSRFGHFNKLWNENILGSWENNLFWFRLLSTWRQSSSLAVREL